MRREQLPTNRRVRRDDAPLVDTGAEIETARNTQQKRGRNKKRLGLIRRLRASRWTARLRLLLGVVLVMAASGGVALGLRRYLRMSPRFSVRQVHVDGNQRRTAHQLTRRANIEIGNNIFAIDERLAAVSIEADPWIAKATVTVDLPNSVFIQVVEREPSALATVGGQLYLVDPTGDIFKEFSLGDPHDLPVVTGIDTESIAHDREGVRLRLRRALELLADLERAKVAKRYPVHEIRIADDGALTLTVSRDGIALAFGLPPYRGKIDKAERILGELRHRKVKPAAVFLDNTAHPERVVVRMQ